MAHFRVVKTSYANQKILFFTYYWFHMAQYISNEFMIVKIIIPITMKYKMMTTNTILQKMLLVTKFLLIMNPKFSSPITYPS
jgi:hypothetical protein